MRKWEAPLVQFVVTVPAQDGSNGSDFQFGRFLCCFLCVSILHCPGNPYPLNEGGGGVHPLKYPKNLLRLILGDNLQRIK